jgi:hypothetical protein
MSNIDKTWLKTKDLLRTWFKWVPADFRWRFARLEQKVRWGIISGERPEMSAEDAIYLQKIYQEHNQKLAQFLERDLPWR